jgi:hypothetical protein
MSVVWFRIADLVITDSKFTKLQFLRFRYEKDTPSEVSVLKSVSDPISAFCTDRWMLEVLLYPVPTP